MRSKPNGRFAAKLLFRYGVRGREPRRTLCEARVVVLKAETARAAWMRARQQGKQEAYSYWNAEGERVAVDFLGIMDLVDLSVLGQDEMWYEMFNASNPSRLLGSRKKFQAFRRGGTVGSAWFAVPREMAEPKLRKPIRSGPSQKRKRRAVKDDAA